MTKRFENVVKVDDILPWAFVAGGRNECIII